MGTNSNNYIQSLIAKSISESIGALVRDNLASMNDLDANGNTIDTSESIKGKVTVVSKNGKMVSAKVEETYKYLPKNDAFYVIEIMSGLFSVIGGSLGKTDKTILTNVLGTLSSGAFCLRSKEIWDTVGIKILTVPKTDYAVLVIPCELRQTVFCKSENKPLARWNEYGNIEIVEDNNAQ